MKKQKAKQKKWTLTISLAYHLKKLFDFVQCCTFQWVCVFFLNCLEIQYKL